MIYQIQIATSNESKKTPEELLMSWAADSLEIEGRSFSNLQNGLKGIFVHVKGDPSNIIDIFISPKLNELSQ